jgi:hypothetical protein
MYKNEYGMCYYALQVRINISLILHHKANLMMCKIMYYAKIFVTNIAQQNTKK